MADMTPWTEVSSSWMNVWGDDDEIAIKNEVFDQAGKNLTFDIETGLTSSSISNKNQVPSSSTNASFIDICSRLDLNTINLSEPLEVSNEEIVSTSPTTDSNGYLDDPMNRQSETKIQMMTEQELATEYLINSSKLHKEEKIEMDTEFYSEMEMTAESGMLDCYKNRLHFVKYVNRDGKNVKIWECGVCGKEFRHQYTLMRHLPTHTDERKFQCNTCGKAFRQMSTLSQHRAIHSTDRPYVCELCRKTFNRVSTLISHRKTHTGLKPHQCHLCHKAFHQKGNLRNHIFTHTNERPYKCDICQKGFNQMSNLMCHKLKAHQRNDKPKHICNICQKEFPKRMALRNHEEYKHGIKRQPSEVINLCDMPSEANPGTANHQTHVIQGENDAPMHILHIPEVLTPPMSITRTPTNARVRYTNGVLVDAINTTAMRQALHVQQANGTAGSPSSAPFALLRPIGGIPVLVRVLSAPQGKHMLVPATAEDLRAHAKFVNPNEQNAGASCSIESTTSLQIKIPVVATVVQKFELDGRISMSVESPGPDNRQLIQDSINNTVESHRNMEFLRHQRAYDNSRPTIPAIENIQGYINLSESSNMVPKLNQLEIINLEDSMPSLHTESNVGMGSLQSQMFVNQMHSNMNNFYMQPNSLQLI